MKILIGKNLTPVSEENLSARPMCPGLTGQDIEWAIDFRTFFEDTCAKPRDNTGKNNCAVYFKGIAIAKLHGAY